MRAKVAAWSMVILFIFSPTVFAQQKVRTYKQAHVSIVIKPLAADVQYRVFLNPRGLRAPDSGRVMAYRCGDEIMEVDLTRVARNRYTVDVLIKAGFDLSAGFSGLAPTHLVHAIVESPYGQYPQYSVQGELTFKRIAQADELTCSKVWLDDDREMGLLVGADLLLGRGGRTENKQNNHRPSRYFGSHNFNELGGSIS